MSSLGKGIFSRHDNDTVLHNNSKFNRTAGTHNILAPNFMTANLNLNSPAIMLDIYSQTTNFGAIDMTLECVSSVIANNSSDFTTCFRVSDIMWLIQDQTFRPAGANYYPIWPEGEQSPLSVTGIAYTLFHWDTLFSRSIPKYIKGLEIVLKHKDKGVYTFKLDGREAIYKGFGPEFTDDNCESRGDVIEIVSMYNWPYTIILVPTGEYDQQFKTKGPIYASVFSVCIVMLTSALFFLYDRLITRGAREKELVINTRRLFVR